MTIAKIAFTAAAIAALTVAPPAIAKNADGEAKLAKLIEGRTAGKPVSCIPAQIDGQRLQIIDDTAVVYDGGSTIYVARPAAPDSLDTDHNILVINRFGSQLCKQDVIRTVDRYSGFTTGVVFLDDFTPYTKK